MSLETNDGDMTKLTEKDTTIPTKKAQTFTTNANLQPLSMGMKTAVGGLTKLIERSKTTPTQKAQPWFVGAAGSVKGGEPSRPRPDGPGKSTLGAFGGLVAEVVSAGETSLSFESLEAPMLAMGSPFS